MERPEITSDERTSRRLLERKKQALLESEPVPKRGSA
jgi:hypothetical protein